MKLSNDEITFIGYGNMGSAIVDGILRDNLFKNIKIVENDKSKFNIKSFPFGRGVSPCPLKS